MRKDLAERKSFSTRFAKQIIKRSSHSHEVLEDTQGFIGRPTHTYWEIATSFEGSFFWIMLASIVYLGFNSTDFQRDFKKRVPEEKRLR